jgi:hypothetical protein
MISEPNGDEGLRDSKIRFKKKLESSSGPAALGDRRLT